MEGIGRHGTPELVEGTDLEAQLVVDVEVEDQSRVALLEVVEDVGVEDLPAGELGDVLADVLADEVVADAVAIAHLPFDISVPSPVEIIEDGYAEVELFLLEGVAAPEAPRQLAVVAELIAGAEIELIGEAAALAVAHIERVEDGVDTDVSLVVLSEMSADAVQHIVADGIPQDALDPVLFLSVEGVGSLLHLLLDACRNHLGIDVLLAGVQGVGAHPGEEQRVGGVVAADGVEDVVQPEVGFAVSRHLVAQEAEAHEGLALPGEDGRHAPLTHRHGHPRMDEVVLALEAAREDAAREAVDGRRAVGQLGVVAAAAEAELHNVAMDDVDTVFIETEVVRMKRRENGVAYHGLAVNGRCEVFAEVLHGLLAVGNGRDLQQRLRGEVLMVVHHNFIICLGEILPVFAVGDDISAGDEHEDGVAAVDTQRGPHIGVALTPEVRGVDGLGKGVDTPQQPEVALLDGSGGKGEEQGEDKQEACEGCAQHAHKAGDTTIARIGPMAFLA